MDAEFLLIGISLGISIALIFGAGVGVNHGLTAVAARKRICANDYPDCHRREAERLLRLSLRTTNNLYANHLRQEARFYFGLAEQIENDPYFAR